MKARNKSLSAVMLLALAIMVNGCNMFEAIDSSINTTSAGDLISEGYGRLAEADYATALNRFDRALEKVAVMRLEGAGLLLMPDLLVLTCFLF